jgi:glycosyltransferase involved in cell wall biosynthesis
VTAAVIVPVRGGDRATQANLNVIATAAAAANVHTYVVDNGTSRWLLRPLAESGRVTVIECPVPGSYQARNAGVRAALGNEHDVLLFTDADCRPEPTWPTHLLALAEQADMAVSLAAPRPIGVLGTGAHYDYCKRLSAWAGGRLVCGGAIHTLDTRACVIRSEVFAAQRFNETLSFAADAVLGRSALASGRTLIGCDHPVLSHDPPRSWRGEYAKYVRIARTLTRQLRSWPRRDVLQLLPEHAHLLLPPRVEWIAASRLAVADALVLALSRKPGWQTELYRAVRELAWMRGWSQEDAQLRTAAAAADPYPARRPSIPDRMRRP